jgi:L-erythro-3,5-diaminohexanoate dehydrogenase
MSATTSASNPQLLHEGDPFGSHRALEPHGALPQPAARLSNDFSKLYRGEVLIAVETLNIDAASFRQMEEAGGSTAAAGDLVLKTVRERGKQHNPVTGSGGMLLGRVRAHGEGRSAATLPIGSRVASLVSLSLTPLRVDKILAIRPESAQIDIEGEAVLFESSAYALLPSDMPERLALAVLDVAGAAPQVARLAKPGMSVLVLGAGGKSGILCAYEAKRRGAKVVGVESYAAYAKDLEGLGICDKVIACDAREPLTTRERCLAANGGAEFDLTLSCVNVEQAEMTAIVCTQDRGTAYFFAMSTSFTRAALGAEGVGKDIDLLIGNGFAHGHADHSLAIMRESPAIRALFEKRYT